MKLKRLISLMLATFIVISSFVCDFSVLYASEPTTTPGAIEPIYQDKTSSAALYASHTTTPGYYRENSEGLRIAGNYSETSYDIYGKNANGQDIITTFETGGYIPFLSTDPSPIKDNAYQVVVPSEGVPVDTGKGLDLTITSAFISGEKYLQVTYTLKNKTSADIPNVSLGVGADIKIGVDDLANIYRTPTGFRLAHSGRVPGSLGYGMQFSLACTNAPGVTNVDTMWFGHYRGYTNNLFESATGNELVGIDSGLAFSWKNRTVPANGELKLSVLFTVGEMAKPIDKFEVTIETNTVDVEAKVTDTIIGAKDMLYYKVNDGEEIPLNYTFATGNEETILAKMDPNLFTAPGDYIIELWVMNDKGSLSETKIIHLRIDDPPPIHTFEVTIETDGLDVTAKVTDSVVGAEDTLYYKVNTSETMVLGSTIATGNEETIPSKQMNADLFSASGHYKIELWVRNDKGSVSDTKIIEFDVEFLPDPPPVEPDEPELVRIGAVVIPKGSGTVTGDGTYLEGEYVELNATPKEGYRFVGWTEEPLSGGKTIAAANTDKPPVFLSTKPKYAFRAKEDRVLGAQFQKLGGEGGDYPEVIPTIEPPLPPLPPQNPETGMLQIIPVPVKIVAGQLAKSMLYTLAIWFVLLSIAIYRKYQEIVARQQRAQQ